MGMYLIKFKLTPGTWARQIEAPEDRRQAVEPMFAAVGGKLHGFWYAFGEDDGYVLGELPDDVVAARTVTKVVASGAFTSMSTTKLITVEEMLEALRGAGAVAYRAPGAAG